MPGFVRPPPISTPETGNGAEQQQQQQQRQQQDVAELFHVPSAGNGLNGESNNNNNNNDDGGDTSSQCSEGSLPSTPLRQSGFTGRGSGAAALSRTTKHERGSDKNGGDSNNNNNAGPKTGGSSNTNNAGRNFASAFGSRGDADRSGASSVTSSIIARRSSSDETAHLLSAAGACGPAGTLPNVRPYDRVMPIVSHISQRVKIVLQGRANEYMQWLEDKRARQEAAERAAEEGADDSDDDNHHHVAPPASPSTPVPGSAVDAVHQGGSGGSSGGGRKNNAVGRRALLLRQRAAVLAGAVPAPLGHQQQRTPSRNNNNNSNNDNDSGSFGKLGTSPTTAAAANDCSSSNNPIIQISGPNSDMNSSGGGSGSEKQKMDGSGGSLLGLGSFARSPLPSNPTKPAGLMYRARAQPAKNSSNSASSGASKKASRVAKAVDEPTSPFDFFDPDEVDDDNDKNSNSPSSLGRVTSSKPSFQSVTNSRSSGGAFELSEFEDGEGVLFAESIFNRIPRYCGPAGHYEKHQMLGQGSFGSTWLVEWVPDAEFAALFGLESPSPNNNNNNNSNNNVAGQQSIKSNDLKAFGSGAAGNNTSKNAFSNTSVSQSRSGVDQPLGSNRNTALAPDCIIHPPNRTGLSIEELHEMLEVRRNELAQQANNTAASRATAGTGGLHSLGGDKHNNSDGLQFSSSLLLSRQQQQQRPPSSPTLSTGSAGKGGSFGSRSGAALPIARSPGGAARSPAARCGAGVSGSSSSAPALASFYTTATPGAISSLACTKSFVRLTNGREVPSDRVFVCKIESNAAAARKNLISSQEFSEEKILSNCAHPCVVGFIDEFVDSQNHYLIMEYVDGGDLRGEIQRRLDAETLKFFSEASLLFLFTQIVMGVEYLHRHNILHRDLKTSNLLLSRKWSVRLADFGFAKQFGFDVDNCNATVTTLGTPYYMAPEVLTKAPYSDKADVWAMGVILYELVTLRRPFDADTVQDLARRIVHDDYDPVDRENVSDELLDLIDSMLQKEPAKRPTAKQVLQQPIMIASMDEFINKFTRAANASSSPLDKLWSKVLGEHRDLVLSDCLTSPKSRTMQQRARSRDVSIMFSRDVDSVNANNSMRSDGGGAGSPNTGRRKRKNRTNSTDSEMRSSVGSYQSDEDSDADSNDGSRSGRRKRRKNQQLSAGTQLSNFLSARQAHDGF